jgi:hypothetical protein
MLETRRNAIEGHVQQRVRACRNRASDRTARPPADLPNEPADERLASAFAEMQARTLKNITAALVLRNAIH